MKTSKPLDLTKKITTRDGRAVEILSTFKSANGPMLAALVTDHADLQHVALYLLDGTQPFPTDGPHAGDLINVPDEFVIWQVVVDYGAYDPGNHGQFQVISYPSRGAAERIWQGSKFRWYLKQATYRCPE